MTTAGYHYTESGLDNVWLANGFHHVDGPAGREVVIKDIDGLHRAIGGALIEKESLTGKEIRFLRQEMLMSQSLLAKLLQVSEQAIHRWEKGKSEIPKPAETLIRLLYREQHDNATKLNIKDKLQLLAQQEHENDIGKMMLKKPTGKDWRVELPQAA